MFLCRCEATASWQSTALGCSTRLIATLVTLARNDTMSATKVAPPNIHYFLSLRALAKQSTGTESPTTKQRIPRKSARKAMAKPQHSRALKFAIPQSAIAHRFYPPNHSAQRQCSSRRRNVDACAVDYDICKCNAQLKGVRGFGGLLRGIRRALRK